jgi:colicin import membrane protein
VLALAVHAIFLTLLYFGVNWHVKAPQDVAVERWDYLPDLVPEIAPTPPLPPPPEEPPKVEPVVVPKVVAPTPPAKVDIELKDKKKKKELSAKEAKLEAGLQAKENEKVKQAEKAKQLELEKQSAADTARENERVQAQQARMRAEMESATQAEVARYTDLIRGKIKRNIVMPPDVPASAEAIFMVIVLPDGSVMDNVRLLKSSGNGAYDNAAERAIYKAQPLPIPQDASLARVFRELRLSVKP